MLSNITGALCEKIPEIHETAKSHDIDIICITESWCSANIPDDCIQIPGYIFYRRDRQDGRACGGIICYIKNNIPVSKFWSNLDDKFLETLWVTIRPSRLPRGISHINIGLVYHPPKCDDWTMCQHLISSVDSIRQNFPSSEFMVLGDFNHMKDKYFKNATEMSQLVKSPTHGSSIIDLCYTSLKSIYHQPLHEPGIGLSKHQTLIFKPKYTESFKPVTFYIEKRKMSSKCKIKFRDAIEQISWEPLYRNETCAEKYELFSDILLQNIDEHFPLVKIKCNSNDLPWVTENFRYLIKQRQYHFNNGNDKMYRVFRNKVNRERKLLKQQFVKKIQCIIVRVKFLNTGCNALNH